MITSLGTGMHADSSTISANTAGAPWSPMVVVTQSTSDWVIESSGSTPTAPSSGTRRGAGHPAAATRRSSAPPDDRGRRGRADRRRRAAAPPAPAGDSPSASRCRAGGPLRSCSPARSEVVAHATVEGVALHGPVARGADGAAEVLDGGAVGGARGRHDVLLEHHGPEVVGAEVERDLADLHPLRDPRRLDVVDVVEVDARDRLREQVVERRRGLGDLLAELRVVGLER